MAAKRTRKLLVWALCLHTSLVFSQATFQRTIGGPGNEVGTWVVETNNGYLVSGHVTSTNGNLDALLVRLDASGNSLWQKRFGAAKADAFHAVVATPDGGFLAVGETHSYGAGNADFFMVQVDASGDVIWSRTAGVTGNDDVAQSVILVEGGGYLITGSSTPAGGSVSNSVFLRLDQDGNTVWSRTCVTNNGNQLLSNYIEGNVLYASGSVGVSASMIRMDLNTGAFLSTNAYTGINKGILSYQQPTQDGFLVLADHIRTSPSNTDMWVQKVNPASGKVLWSKVYSKPNDNLRGRIEKLDDGGFLLVPYNNANVTQADALLTKIDADGNLVWSYNFGGNAFDRLMKAVQTSDGGIVAVGDTRSSNPNGNSDIFLIKTNRAGKLEGNCAMDAALQSADVTVSIMPLTATESNWIQPATLNIVPLPLSLSGAGFNPNPSPNVTRTIPLCPEASYNIGGIDYFAPKMVTDTLTSLHECDTIIHYNLVLSPVNTAIRVIGLCHGQTYVLNGVTYTAPSTALDTIQASTGCDTIYTYVFKAWAQPTATQQIFFCPGESIIIGGQTYSQPGSVQSTLISSTGGCDTLVTYQLVERPQPTQNIQISFCSGEQVVVGGIAYSDSKTVEVAVPSTTGGCDTLVTYQLELLPQPTRTINIGLCPGESVMIGGQAYNQAGVFTFKAPANQGGCDSLITYHIEHLQQETREETRWFCPGETVSIGGQMYDQPGTVVANLASASGGCDTIVTYHLSLSAQPSRTEMYSFCPGESVTIAGQTYQQSGTVVANLASNTGGCDTIVTYTLELRPQAARAEVRGFCPGESVTIAGQDYHQPGTVIENIQSLTGGCDTVVTYTLQHLTPAPSNVAIQCPSDITVAASLGGGPTSILYPLPYAASDCVCPGMDVRRTGGLASGSLFPVGITQVCYSATDNCGQETPCCFKVEVREENPCDVKETACMKYELLSVTADAGRNKTYRVRVTNRCNDKLVYTAIEIPSGIKPMDPLDNTTYESPTGRDYLVRSPNFSPIYSIRFKTTTDSISAGASEIFEYTLPAQADVEQFNIISSLSTQASYEAYLNTYKCIIGISPNNFGANSRDAGNDLAQNSSLLFPNPTKGVFFADLTNWRGQKLQLNITNTQGQRVLTKNITSNEELHRLEMPQGVTNGAYFLEVLPEKGEKQTHRFVLQR
jgi:hypothetical protein